MKYKANFQPSFLLCPEKYTWHTLTECLPKLDVAKYQRLGVVNGEDEDGKVSTSNALVLYKRVLMTYDVYIATLRRNMRPSSASLEAEAERISEFAYLVGKKCLNRMALFCDNAPVNHWDVVYIWLWTFTNIYNLWKIFISVSKIEVIFLCLIS